MIHRDVLIYKLLDIIGDYREGEIKKPDFQHIQKWIEQFPKEKESLILEEMIYVLGKTYLSKARVEGLFSSLIEQIDLVGTNPVAHWSSASLLDIQKGGYSQHEITTLTSSIIKAKYGVEVKINSRDSNCYYYLDDNLCSGRRVSEDLASWIVNDAPNDIKLIVCMIALHTYGYWVVQNKLKEVIQASKKKIIVIWRWGIKPEDRKSCTDSSDVLRPVSLPQDQQVHAYVQKMKYPPKYRAPGNVGKLSFFSSEEGRNLLEQEFLIKGAQIKSMCQHLKIPHRPLGFSSLDTLGFGSMIVTYRNCPNNAPLTLWANEPWYPLFPRSTNKDAMIRRVFENF